jgi:hypothetical protein
MVTSPQRRQPMRWMNVPGNRVTASPSYSSPICFLIGPREAHVRDETEEPVVNRAGSGPWRNLDDGRPVGLQIEYDAAVNGVRISGEKQRIGRPCKA